MTDETSNTLNLLDGDVVEEMESSSITQYYVSELLEPLQWVLAVC